MSYSASGAMSIEPRPCRDAVASPEVPQGVRIPQGLERRRPEQRRRADQPGLAGVGHDIATATPLQMTRLLEMG